MSGPVDVLAVLDSLIEYHDTLDSLKGRNCIKARAAVAELIEKLDKYLDSSTLDARMDLIDALANIGGQP